MKNNTSFETADAGDSMGIPVLKEDSRKHNRYLRLLADFDNYRRRVERERISAAGAAKREILLALLDVIDDFERAIPHTAAAPGALSEGVQAIHRNLLCVVDAEDAAPFRNLGEPFDPALHDAVGEVHDVRYDSGAVAEEARRGYRWRGEQLRPARVIVSR